MSRKKEWSEKPVPLPKLNISAELQLEMIQRKVKQRDLLPIYYKILRFLGEVGFATESQLIRYLVKDDNTDIGSVKEQIKILFNQQLIGSFSITTPPHLGFGMLKIKTIYAKEKAREKVRTTIAELAFGRYGKPVGENLKRVLHELIITESYIWYVEQGNKVIWFMTENELKSNLGKKRWKEMKRDNLYFDGANHTGDFKICYVNLKTFNMDVRMGEAAVKYKKPQITAKPTRIDWFCISESQARMIEQITGAEPQILRKFLIEARQQAIEQLIETQGNTETTTITEAKYVRREQKIIQTLEAMGGCCTTDVLASVLKLSKSFLTLQRHVFTQSGKIKISTAKLLPGTTRGRTGLIWHLPGITFTQQELREFLTRSYVAVGCIDNGFELVGFHQKRSCVIFERKKDGKKAAIMCDFFADETEEISASADFEKMARYEALFRDERIHFYVAFTNKTRLEMARPMLREGAFEDCTDDDRLKSYYRTSDLIDWSFIKGEHPKKTKSENE